VDPRVRHRHLEAFDEGGGPGPRLLRVIQAENGMLRKWGDPIGNSALGISSGPLPAKIAGSTTWEFHHEPSASAIRRVLSP